MRPLLPSVRLNMTIAYWCVLIAALLPYVLTGYAKGSARGYDNRAPRDWQARLEGRAARAHWAHLNSFEAFPFFAAAVIIAHLAGGEQNVVDWLAMGFIAARIVYSVLYIAGIARLRSVVWALGFFATIALFIIAA